MDASLLCPLRPPLDEPAGPADVGGDVEGWENLEDADVLPYSEVIGYDGEVDEVNEDGNAVQVAVPVPEPPRPTQREIDKHNLTHASYKSWCPACVAGRRPNSQHRSHSSAPTTRMYATRRMLTFSQSVWVSCTRPKCTLHQPVMPRAQMTV